MKDPEQLSANIDTCLEMLFQSRTRLYESIESVIDKRTDLDAAKQTAYDAGLIDGKNEDTRKVQYKSHCHAQYEALEQAERAERNAQYEFEHKRDLYETQKLHLRLLELAK